MINSRLAFAAELVWRSAWRHYQVVLRLRQARTTNPVRGRQSPHQTVPYPSSARGATRQGVCAWTVTAQCLHTTSRLRRVSSRWEWVAVRITVYNGCEIRQKQTYFLAPQAMLSGKTLLVCRWGRRNLIHRGGRHDHYEKPDQHHRCRRPWARRRVWHGGNLRSTAYSAGRLVGDRWGRSRDDGCDSLVEILHDGTSYRRRRIYDLCDRRSRDHVGNGGRPGRKRPFVCRRNGAMGNRAAAHQYPEGIRVAGSAVRSGKRCPLLCRRRKDLRGRTTAADISPAAIYCLPLSSDDFPRMDLACVA